MTQVASEIQVATEVSCQPLEVSWKLDYNKRIQELELEISKRKKALPWLNTKPQHFLYYLGLFICIGGFMYGLNVSLISGALLFLKPDMHLDTPQESLISSGMSLGGIGGALLYVLYIFPIFPNYEIYLCIL